MDGQLEMVRYEELGIPDIEDESPEFECERA